MTTAVAAEKPAHNYIFPIIDYPFNWSNGYTAPSMQQSLQLTNNVYFYAHQQFSEYFRQRPGRRIAANIVFDIASIWLPFGTSWLHEEWHRAVMSRRQIKSYNEVYKLNFFDETISVSRVSDEDLTRLKAENPADLVRLNAAGIEAQIQHSELIEQDIFFHDRHDDMDLIHWLNYANAISYLYVCASNESTTLTNELLADEDTNIADRDFTGLDCNAWVYDLFRPDEDYSARGIHPSGVGINRYISYDKLTDSEKDYLKKQYRYSFLNLINPMLYRFDGFTSTNPFNHKTMHWNANLKHYLTSFGYSIDVNFLGKQGKTNTTLSLHNFFNKNHYFPGLSIGLLDLPIILLHKSVSISQRFSLWLQPAQQNFFSSQADAGGLLNTQINFPLTKTLSGFVELEAKTDGWVAGNVYLDDNLSLRTGFVIQAF